jgi:hypothetical protein
MAELMIFSKDVVYLLDLGIACADGLGLLAALGIFL